MSDEASAILAERIKIVNHSTLGGIQMTSYEEYAEAFSAHDDEDRKRKEAESLTTEQIDEKIADREIRRKPTRILREVRSRRIDSMSEY